MQNNYKIFRLFVFCVLLGAYEISSAETIVTTYVTKVQEERKSTRFTLTEWLKIKERMRLMDIWLAMFGNLKEKNKFTPEVRLKYGLLNNARIVSTAPTESEATQGNFGELQIWLTNLISSQLGIRTLNIDLGLELAGRMSQRDSAQSGSGLGLAAMDLLSGPQGSESVHGYSGNLRIFGKNIQDSSLIFKYGQYTWEDPFFNDIAETTDPTATLEPNMRFSGNYYGGEMQLYLFHWLGAEASYLKYARSEVDELTLKGSSLLNYGAYIEISILRLFGGYSVIEEEYTYQDGEPEQTDAKGLYYGLQINI